MRAPDLRLRAPLAAALLLAAPVAGASPREGCEREGAGVADLTAQIEESHRFVPSAEGCEGHLEAALTNRSASTAFCGVAPVRWDGTIERPAWITIRPGETLGGLSWCGFPAGSVRLVCVEEGERDWCVMERFARLRFAQEAGEQVAVQLAR